jgi:hypothetical protein
VRTGKRPLTMAKEMVDGSSSGSLGSAREWLMESLHMAHTDSLPTALDSCAVTVAAAAAAAALASPHKRMCEIIGGGVPT